MRAVPSQQCTAVRITSRFLVLSVALFALGCGGMFKGKQAAEQSVADFHKLYNDDKAVEIFSAAHSKFQGATTEERFLEFIGAVRRKLGKVTGSTSTGFNVRSINLTTTVILTQNTTFEQGTGKETFTYEMVDDKAVLVGYNISSDALILK